MTTEAKRSFHTLDALRGVAALSIVLFHGSFLYGLRPPPEGQVAVDVFFVVSGFIIAYRYDGRFAAGLTAPAFLRRRLVRLYPLALLGSLLGAVPAVAAFALGEATPLHRHLLEALPLAAAMLPAPTASGETAYLYPLNAPAWTLALEILANGVYAATFSWWTSRRLLAALGLAAAGLGLTAWSYGTLDVGFFPSQIWGGLARIGFGFLAGVLLFRVHRAGRLPAFAPWWGPLAIAAALFLLPPPIARGWWDLVLVCLAAPTLVALAAGAEPPSWARRACTLSGAGSYVVYSIHFPLIGLVMRGETALHLDGNAASWGRAAAFTGLLLAASLVAHFGYDRPVRRRLASWGAAPPLALSEATAKS